MKKSRLRTLVAPEANGLRLDQFLARHVEGLSRRTAKIALDIGCVFVNSKRVKVASRKVRTGDEVDTHLGGAFERALANPDASEITPDVLFEDDAIVVVSKPAGVLTAPTPESDRNNLLRALEQRVPGAERLFVVHRLDLQTSGVLMFAKTPPANRILAEMFREHRLVREYDAFGLGKLETESLRVEVPIGGKRAISNFTRFKEHALWTWCRVRLETGRTHQIRIHAESIGLPILQDPEHGKKVPWGPPRMALHARQLAFRHPLSEQELSFEAPLPEDLASWALSQG
ncbi:MAG TPA: RluA family pseudouridine synthase [Polyangiaceae bacterium]|nr:RluA family pseudouridine synthase [Polyangiaceae bacterium]